MRTGKIKRIFVQPKPIEQPIKIENWPVKKEEESIIIKNWPIRKKIKVGSE